MIMDKKQLQELAKDPRFIPGIYNYCDRWCERCAFTFRCMTFALEENESDGPQSYDIHNKAFWDKLHDIFQLTLEMVSETAEQMGIDINAIDHDEMAEQTEQVHNLSKVQPYSLAAESYIHTVNVWFDSNEVILKEKVSELQTLAQADIPGVRPSDEVINIEDCLEVIRWYQHQIYVKLCRAASGLLHSKFGSLEYSARDANGSAKVAIIGIKRSMAAWGYLLNRLPDQERGIIDMLVSLKRLLRQIETAFPDARMFLRPGFDIPVEEKGEK
jgi:hypothetical protein